MPWIALPGQPILFSPGMEFLTDRIEPVKTVLCADPQSTIAIDEQSVHLVAAETCWIMDVVPEELNAGGSRVEPK